MNILVHGNLTLFVVALYRLLPPLEYSLLCMKSANLLYITTLKVFKNMQFMFSLKKCNFVHSFNFCLAIYNIRGSKLFLESSAIFFNLNVGIWLRLTFGSLTNDDKNGSENVARRQIGGLSNLTASTLLAQL